MVNWGNSGQVEPMSSISYDTTFEVARIYNAIYFAVETWDLAPASYF